MEEEIILIGYRIDLLNLSLLAKKNIYDANNESIPCKCIFIGLEIFKGLIERNLQYLNFAA